MKRLVFGVVTVAAILFSGACGGGGGASFVQFIYFTDWGAAPSSESQIVRLMPESGGPGAQLVINNSTGGQQSVTFPNTARGVYIIHVTLHSQPNASGSITGVVKDRIVVNSGNRTYRTSVGREVVSLVVNPNTATIQVQGSIQLYAVGKDITNITTFVAPGSILWEALNAFVSVNQEGIVVGEAQGEGLVRATHVPTANSNSATITVTPFNATQTKWTIMVFLNAANDLDVFSDLNVNQMERVANNAEVRFIVQWKRVQALGYGSPWSGTRRYRVTYDPSSNNNWSGIQSELIQDMGPGIDMGNWQTLRDFVNWTQTFYPAERYVLVVWDHGSGWRLVDELGGTRGVSFDDEFGTHIKTWELSQALTTTDQVDILSWDASLMQMMEVAYEVKDRVQYMVGSEESPPGPGLPYHLVFGPLRDNPDMGTEAFTAKFGEGMMAQYGSGASRITQSTIRADRIPALAAALDNLAGELILHRDNIVSAVQQARANSQSYSPSALRVYRDLWHLCFNLKELTPGFPTIQAACDDVMAQVEFAVVNNFHNSLSPNSHGVSIEFGDQGQPYWAQYGLLALSGATRWRDWLMIAP